VEPEERLATTTALLGAIRRHSAQHRPAAVSVDGTPWQAVMVEAEAVTAVVAMPQLRLVFQGRDLPEESAIPAR
jgi:hypothetical protein